MASLSLKHIYKVYAGGVRAVSDFNLEIDDKEFVVFDGPSGCGKSTTLRMIAGLEEISSGELYIDGRLVNDVEPKDRDIAMVFQNYALYPHMTVYDNMAFGLRLRKMPSEEIDSRVQEAANILGITELLSRKPKALSGGQRQRVALGRAIVREPKVFLLDEPLSNLDAKLRVQMRTEITKLHNKLATTFIYVTHDQTEAMTMGTRIVVMKSGIVQQVDTPQCLYDNPDNLFVASFLGSPQMNFFKATIVKESGGLYAVFGENKVLIPQARARRLMDEAYIGQEVVFGVRPEDIHDEEIFIASSPDTVIDAEIDVIEKLGNETILYMNIEGKEDYAVARVDARSQAVAGDKMRLAIDANHVHFFDPNTELSIMGVPRVNRIPAKMLAESDKIAVRFGNIKIDLDEQAISRIVDMSVVNKDIILEIAPGDITDKATFDANEIDSIAEDESTFTIDGVVEFTEKYPRYMAAYVAVPGKKGFVVAKLAEDTTITGGDKITLCGKVKNVQVSDIETGNNMIAYMPITSNAVMGTVNVKVDVATVAFGKSKITFPVAGTVFETEEFKAMQSGAVKADQPNKIQPIPVNLTQTAFAIGKEAVAANPKSVIEGRVVDADAIGEVTVLYAKVEGVEDYVSAIVKQEVNMNVGDKVKIVVDPAMITIGELASRKDIIAELAQQAPAYVFEEEKPVAKAVPADKPAPAKKAPAKKAPAKKPAAKKTTAK